MASIIAVKRTANPAEGDIVVARIATEIVGVVVGAMIGPPR